MVLSSKKPKDGKKKIPSSSHSVDDKGVTTVDPSLEKAAEKVALSIPGQGPKVKSDLLQRLQSFAKLSQTQAARDTTVSASAGVDSAAAATKLSTLLSGMQIQKGRERPMEAEDMEGTLRDGKRQPGLRRQFSNPDREKVKLFRGQGLGIFSAADSLQTEAQPVTESIPGHDSLWERVRQEQLAVLSSQPPTNAFEEMIQWTKKGILWHYPINNEQGMDEEAKVGFHEHVFLEDQIQDFPRRGPIRHFMELVLVGLSKNPYLTVQHKREHIDWFRQYFKDKRDVLEEALGPDGLIAEPQDQQKLVAKSKAN